MCKDPRTISLLEVPESVKERFNEQAKPWGAMQIMRSLHVLSKADVEYKQSKNHRLLIEIVLMQMCSLQQELEKKKD